MAPKMKVRLTETEEPPALFDLIFAVMAGFGLHN